MIIDNSILKQKPLAEGGEGEIYPYQDKIIKCFKPVVDIKEKLEKVKLWIPQKLPNYIVKPLDIVTDNQNKFIGYLMGKVEGEDLRQLCNRNFIKINNVTLKDITELAIKIKNVLIALHGKNIFISDLNENNILFDKKFNPFFIDVDSWTIGKYFCTVCTPIFQDPLLTGINFTKETDYFSFAVLLFKIFTRVHPYGGTIKPVDMDILDRMNSRISIIDKQNIKVSPVARKWDFISPSLLNDFQDIFEKDKRFLIDKTLEDFNKNLKLCPKHNDYYYGKFSTCPVCDANAIIQIAPIKIQTDGELPFIILLSFSDVKLILNQNSYIDNNDWITHNLTKKKVKYISGNRYYFSNDGENLFAISNNEIKLSNIKGIYTFDKKYKSPVVHKNNELFYIDNNLNLICLTVTNFGNSFETITRTSFNSVFDIYNKNEYFICNVFSDFKLLDISGYQFKFQDKSKIVNYGIHFDEITKKWLFIIENEKGIFQTYVFNKNKLEFESDALRYAVDLGNLCFSNGNVFRAGDGYIKGFNYTKNVYKDFNCKGVKDGSKLIRDGKSFIVINEKEIIKVG